MKTSETLTKFIEAFGKAQSSIKFAVENATNPHLKNRYADLSAVIDAIKPALAQQQIAFVQMPESSDDGKLHLTTRLMHMSGEYIESTASCPLPKNDPQGFGSALTYLRRYSLSAICGLYADDDDGQGAQISAPNINVDELVKTLKSATSLKDLTDKYAECVAKCNGDPKATNLIRTEATNLKKQFETKGN
jgi:hypothetical protein